MKRTSVLSSEEWPSKVGPHTVTFVRHAEKAGPGFSADLTEKGRRDSEAVGSRIPYKVDLFISSPSPRAVSTALGIRKGNDSAAPLVQEDQLAEPGLGYCTDYQSAMKSFLACILRIIDDNRADIVVATTHNYVVEYVAHLPGCRAGELDYLSAITVNIEVLSQIAESL